MNPILSAIRIGLRRGWTEFRHSLARPDEYGWDVLVAAVLLTVLYFQRDNAVPGTSLSLATVVLPGVLGMLVAFNTLLATALTSDSFSHLWCCAGWLDANPEPPWKQAGKKPPNGSAEG